MNTRTISPGVGAAQIADALVAFGLGIRQGPPGLRPLLAGQRVIGPARPARHFGSVDVFLEAMTAARPGDVLVADNGGRLDEGCIGDLVTLEAKKAGIAGIVIFGANRDTAQLRAIGLPVWSLGARATGPLKVFERMPDCLASARLGDEIVTLSDWIVADDDGAILFPADAADKIIAKATEIAAKEVRQAAKMEAGETLRAQLDFQSFLKKRGDDPAFTFRAYLRGRSGAVEE